MSNSPERTLLFSANDLGREVTLAFVFDADKTGNNFPICYRAIQLPSIGHAIAQLNFNLDRTAFFVPMIQSDIVSVAAWINCSVGQKCEVLPGPEFSPPTQGVQGALECTNMSDKTMDIGVGFDQGEKVSPCVLWTNIPNQNSVITKPPFILSIYAMNDYREGQIIKGEIPSPLLWRGDISSLSEVTRFRVSYDPATGMVRVTPEEN